MAHLLGWTVEGVALRANGGGFTEIIWPVGLDGSRRVREGAVIRLAGRAHTGWTSGDGDSQDQREAWEAAAEATSSVQEAGEFFARLRAYTETRVATTEFRNLALAVEHALFERGRLSGRDVRCLLAGRSLDAEAA